jgi:hypothetical protein
VSLTSNQKKEGRNMDTIENASPPQEQPEIVLANCWEFSQSNASFAAQEPASTPAQ